MFFSRLFPSLLLILALQTHNAQSELLECNEPSNFTVQISESRNVTLYGGELTIAYEPNVTVYAYPGTNAMNLLFNGSIIRFNANTGIEKTSERDFWVGSGQDSGFIEFKELKNNVYSVLKPTFLLPPTSGGSKNLPYFVQDKIQQNVQSCIATHLCGKIEDVKENQLQFNTNFDKFDPLSITTKGLNEILSTKGVVICGSKAKFVETGINILVDVAVRYFSRKVKEEGKSRINLPPIDEKFHTGSGIFQINGRFQASDGYFEDTSSIVRKGDARLKKNGSKYTITSAFEVKKASVKYKSYMMTYSFIKFGGKLTADVTGLTAEAKMTLDFTERQCHAQLEYVEVIDLGKLNLQLTGLGQWSDWASKVMIYFTKYWKDKAIRVIKGCFAQVINDSFKVLNCKR